jgi:hypothetical protein
MIILLILFLYLVQVTHPDFKKAKDKVMFKKKEGVPEGLYMWNNILYYPWPFFFLFGLLCYTFAQKWQLLCIMKVELYPYAGKTMVKSVVWEIECKLWFILVPHIFVQISLNLEIVSYPNYDWGLFAAVHGFSSSICCCLWKFPT